MLNLRTDYWRIPRSVLATFARNLTTENANLDLEEGVTYAANWAIRQGIGWSHQRGTAGDAKPRKKTVTAIRKYQHE